jgi:LPS-assembly protein
LSKIDQAPGPPLLLPMLRALMAIVLIALPVAAGAQTAAGPPGCRLTSDIPMNKENVNDPARPDVQRWFASRNIVIECDNLQLTADAFEWYTDQDLFHLRGHIELDSREIHLYADRAELDRKTRLGTFFNAHGTQQTSQKKPTKDLFGGLEPDVAFWADELKRTGPDTFEIGKGGGGFTSCVQATPRWSLTGTRGTFVRDSHVTFWNAVLRVKGVPVFYVPFIYHPINAEGRSTGLLMPSFGSSTVGGFTLSNAFFWAIDRSHDATFFHDYLKKAGTGFGVEYRFVSSPASNGNARVYTLGERANPAIGTTVARRSYSVEGQFNHGMPHGFRLTGQANYFTSATTQQLYQQDALDSSRTRFVSAALTGSHRRYRMDASFALNDVYNNNSLTQAARRGYAPRAILSMAEAPIGRSRVYFGASGESAYLISQDDLAQASTNHSLLRFDATPTLRWPMSSLSYLSVTTSASWRVTEWMESLDPTTSAQRATPLFRQLFGLQTRLVGPVLSRVWQPKTSQYAERVKHVVEPSLAVQWTSPFDRLAQVVKTDGTDSIVGGSTTLTWGVSNRFLVRHRRAAAASAGPVQQVLSVDIVQSHYTNALAAAVDAQYQPCATGAFSAVQVVMTAQPAAKLSGQFHTDINPQFHTPCTLGATGGLNFRPVQISVGWTKKEYIPGLVNFSDPAQADQFVNGAATFKNEGGHLGGAYSFYYDVHHGVLLQQRLVMFYNSQCCGLSIDYQTRSLSALIAGLQSNRTIGISFTLAGLGSFSNPLGAFGK